MKTTIDLPDNLVRQLKLRAVREGRKLKDLTAELLREGLSAPAAPKTPRQPVVVKHKKTGLPVIVCRRTPPPGEELTPEKIADLLLEQEVQWARGGGSRDPS